MVCKANLSESHAYEYIKSTEYFAKGYCIISFGNEMFHSGFVCHVTR